MGVYVDVVTARAMSVTAFVTLSGDKSGTAALYTMNAKAKSLLAVAPYCASGLTAAETALIELRISSQDATAIAPYSCFAQPVPGGLGATVTGQTDPFMNTLMPVNAPVEGNDSILFEARALVLNTVEPLVGALVYWSTEAPRDKPIHSQVTAVTAVPTTAVPTSGPVITVSGQKKHRLKAIQALFTTLVQVAADRRIGFFTVDSTGLTQDHFIPAEPISGMLGAVGSSAQRLTLVKNIDDMMEPPLTVNTTFTQEEAALAARFATGIFYEDV